MVSRLKPEILEQLLKITSLNEKSLGEKLSRKSSETGLSRNAVAHLIAMDYGKSLMGKLDSEDKAALRDYQLIHRPATTVVVKSSPRQKSKDEVTTFKAFKNYKAADYFAEQYILEISRAYKAKCYTSVFILTRKVVENLIIKTIEAKFPGRDELIYNNKKTRTLDFSAILANLEREKAAFNLNGIGAIDRLIPLVDPFKEDANAKAHRWYHIVKSPTEIDNWQLDTIMELITILEKEVGIKAK